MTAEIVNLRKARKQVARKADERRAEENREKFGEKPVRRQLRKAEEARADLAHRSGRLAPIGDEDPQP